MLSYKDKNRRHTQPIQWAVLVTLMLEVVWVIYGFGRLAERLDDHTQRLDRIERVLDGVINHH